MRCRTVIMLHINILLYILGLKEEKISMYSFILSTNSKKNKGSSLVAWSQNVSVCYTTLFYCIRFRKQFLDVICLYSAVSFLIVIRYFFSKINHVILNHYTVINCDLLHQLSILVEGIRNSIFMV